MNNRNEIIKMIIDGGVVAVPTDTVYGFATLPSKIGQKKLAELKHNELDKKYTIALANIHEANLICKDQPKVLKLIKAFLPGPLTIITMVNGESVGIRVPAHEQLADILQQTGPLYLTSANISKHLPLTNAKEINAQFGVLVLKGENGNEEPSTIIKVDGDSVLVTRSGHISEDMIKDVI